MMKIEAGKSYKTRDGRKASKPEWDGYHGCWYLLIDPGAASERAIRAYHSDGTHGNDRVRNDPRLDLVAEWADEPTGPVVVETIKRIVPGTYGIIRVHFDGSFSIVSTRIPAEIRAAAATLTEIADALDEGAR